MDAKFCSSYDKKYTDSLTLWLAAIYLSNRPTMQRIDTYPWLTRGRSQRVKTKWRFRDEVLYRVQSLLKSLQQQLQQLPVMHVIA